MRKSLSFSHLTLHSTQAHQFPAIYSEGRQFRPQVLLAVWRGLVGLHRRGMSEGRSSQQTLTCVLFVTDSFFLIGFHQQSHKYSVLPRFIMRGVATGQVPPKCSGPGCPT
jgi:hypothetical protein